MTQPGRRPKKKIYFQARVCRMKHVVGLNLNSLSYLFNALRKYFFGLLLIVCAFSIYSLLHFFSSCELVLKRKCADA